MQRTRKNLNLAIILMLMGLVYVFASSCTTDQAETAVDSINSHTEESNEKLTKDSLDEAEDTAVALDTDDRGGSWIGRYKECLHWYDHKSKKLSEETYAEEEYVPYIELFENGGEYHFNINWYTEMSPVSGTWEIDEHNKKTLYIYHKTVGE